MPTTTEILRAAGYVTVAEAARRLGVSRQRVYVWIAADPSLASDGLLTIATVARLRERPTKAGRPRKHRTA